MRHYTDAYIYCGAFSPVLSIEELTTSGRGKADEPGLEYPDPAYSIEERCERRQAFEAISAFLASMTPRDLEIVRRVFWLGETQTSVAKDLHVSKMAVCKALRRVFARGRIALARYRYLSLDS